MSFIILYKEPITITFKELNSETVEDLKRVITKHYDISIPYLLLDLGRVMHDNEILKEIGRNSFTLHLINST